MKIGVLAFYGGGNIGNEASAAAIVQNLRKINPNAQITCISLNPSITGSRYNAKALPIWRFVRSKESNISTKKNFRSASNSIKKQILFKTYLSLKNNLKNFKTIYKITQQAKELLSESIFLIKAYLQLKKLDCLVIAGTGILEDAWDNAWGHPYTIYKWSKLAKLANSKLYYLSVGAGPINSALSKYFIIKGLECASYVSFRDRKSKELCESLGYLSESYVYPDVAHSLFFDNPVVKIRKNKSDLVVGINTAQVYHECWPETDPQKYANFVTCMSAFLEYLISQKYIIKYFSTDLGDSLIMNDICDNLKKRVGENFEEVEIIHNKTVNELLDTLYSTDVVVSSRLHGIILSFLCGKPVIGICTDSRQSEFMRDTGRLDYSISSERIEFNQLKNMFEKLLKNRESIVKENKTTSQMYRKKLYEQYINLNNTFHR